jgi:hypothetical protein
MKSFSPTFVRGAAALAVVAGLAVVSIPAFSKSEGDRSARHEQARQHVQQRLDKMAERLRITPAQQNVWAQYRNAVESIATQPGAKPEKDADAATIVRWRADRAAEHARKMNSIADATATLQSALDSEQRKTLGEIVRRNGYDGERHRGPHAKDRSTS